MRQCQNGPSSPLKHENDLVNLIKPLIFGLCIFCAMNTSAYTQQRLSESRGELLYSTHCNACHTAEVYWREQKLATDWNSLKAQVNRWQSYIGLGWNEEDIIDVAHYLNTHYYNFPNTEPKAFSQSKEHQQILPKH